MSAFANIIGTLQSNFSVGKSTLRAIFTASTSGLDLDKPLITDGFGSRIVETATTPYAVTNEYLICVDATAGNKVIDLPLLASVADRVIQVVKTDSSANTVTVNPGASTIDGMSSFVLYSQYDLLEVSAAPTEFVITNFFLGRSLLQSDPFDVLILDHSAGGFASAIDLDAAEVLAAAQSDSFSLANFVRYVITVDLTDAGSASTLFVASRTTGKVGATVGDASDWRYFRTDDINRLTGQSLTQAYEDQAPINGPRMYTFSFLTWGSIGSVIVWLDNATGVEGNVYVQRFVSG